MPDIKTKSPRNTSTKVNSRINNHYSGPLKSVGPKDSAVVTSKGGKFRTVCEEHQTGTTGSPTAENENHQPDNNNQHNAEPTFDRKRHLIGDEFFKQPNSTSSSNNISSLVGPSSNPPQGSSSTTTSNNGSISGFETNKNTVVTSAVAPEDLTRIPTIVASSDENGALIYEASTSPENHHLVTTFDTHANSGTPPEHSPTNSETNDITLTEEELLLKRFEHNEDGSVLVTYTNDEGPIANSSIIDASKLGLYGSASSVTVAEFAQHPQVTYMASILSQDIKNEPEDLTGNRRGSSGQDEVPGGLHNLSGLKLNEKPAGVVVSSPDGPVFLTPADLTSSSVQPVVTSADGTPGFATDFTTFEAPRTISYQDTQYRPENELYCTSGEFANQRIATNSDGHFVPYQYKVAPGPLTNHSVINSPDSGIGELNNATGQPESFDSYPHADILNEIGGRKAWHHDYGRPNEEKVIIQKLHNNYGFKYTLEAPTSSSVRKEDDRITYVNKGQFYGITLEYVLDPEGPPLKSTTVKSIIMVVFREGKTTEDENKCWNFWHTRQHSVKQRILDADTKNSVGLSGPIEEISHNALAVYWTPYESGAKVNLAVQCLSTDFSTQKGVKGMPLHIQIDTYDDPRDSPGTPVYHRGYCQIKVFCDKGAERKARDEERRSNKRKANNSSKRRIDELYHSATERSEFYTMADVTKPASLFTPTNDPEKAALEFGTELPSYFPTGSRESPPEHAMLKLNGSNGSPSPTETPATVELRQDTLQIYGDVKPLMPTAGNNGMHQNHTLSLHGLPEKRARILPPTSERIMIYVKQDSELAFTALHLKPPTIQGLILALESKYKINGRSIRHLHRVNRLGHKVKIDDDMITHYSHQAAFDMQVVMTDEHNCEDSAVYDITLTDIEPWE